MLSSSAHHFESAHFAYMNRLFRDAAEQGDEVEVRRLLTHPAVEPASLSNYALRWACAGGHAEVVHLLLADPRVDPCDGDLCPLVAACKFGRLPVVQALMADGRIDVASRGAAALSSALASRHWHVTAHLLRHPAVDPTACGNAAIRAAVECGETAIVTRLLADPRVDPAVDGLSCVRTAAQRGDCETLSLLLQCRQVQAALRSESLASIMQAVARAGRLETLRLLLGEVPRISNREPATVYTLVTSIASCSTAPALREVLEDEHIAAHTSGEALRTAAGSASQNWRSDLVALLMADERLHTEDDGLRPLDEISAVYGACLRNPTFATQVFLADARAARAVRAFMPPSARPIARDRPAIAAAIASVTWRRRAAVVLARAARYTANK